jgi:hypothetical protein
MANLTEVVNYDAGVYQLETTDPVQGGPSGIANSPLKNLANRTAWLKKHVDDLESGATIPPGIAKVDSQTFTGTPKVPTAPMGDRSLLISNTTFVQDTAHGTLSKNVAGNTNVTLAAQEAGYAILVLTGALTGNIDVIVPATSHSFIVDNRTTGAYTLRVKTAAGTGIYITQGKRQEVFCDGTNVLQSTTDFTDTALTGNPTAPTAASGSNGSSVATTAFVNNAIDGIATINVAGGSDVTATVAQAGSGILNLTGILTANINFILPTQSGQWIIANNATGSFNITAKLATGTGVVLPQGLAVVVYSDGTNVYLASSAGQNSFKPQVFNPSAGTTSLTIVGGYTPGNIIVKKNGVWLDEADYTATNGTTVVLNVATIAGDKVTVYIFSSFQVANAVTTSQYAADFLSLKATNGYQKLPNGMIIQWGTVTPPAYTTTGAFQTTPFLFPIAFPNGVASCVGTLSAGNSGLQYVNLSIEAVSKTGANVIYASGGGNTAIVAYIAIGW